MIKLSVIRDNSDTPCPFGLDITKACQVAGESVDKMQAIKDDDSKTAAKNIAILDQNPSPGKCKYAAHLFKDKPKFVDCDYGDTAAGTSKTPFLGSPYYTQTFEGLGMGGSITYPITTDTDGQEYHNIYYGISGFAARAQRRQDRLALLKIIQVLKN